LEQRLRLALDLGQPEQEVLGRDVLVLQPVGLLLGLVEDVLRGAGDTGLRAGGARQRVQRDADVGGHPPNLRADLLAQRQAGTILSAVTEAACARWVQAGAPGSGWETADRCAWGRKAVLLAAGLPTALRRRLETAASGWPGRAPRTRVPPEQR